MGRPIWGNTHITREQHYCFDPVLGWKLHTECGKTSSICIDFDTFLSCIIVSFGDDLFLDCITGRKARFICSQERSNDTCIILNSFLRKSHYLHKTKICRFRVDSKCRTDHWVRATVPATIGHGSKWNTNRVLGNICIVADCRNEKWESIPTTIIFVNEKCCLDWGWLLKCDLPKLRSNGCTLSFWMQLFKVVPSPRDFVYLHYFTVTACTCCLTSNWIKWILFC